MSSLPLCARIITLLISFFPSDIVNKDNKLVRLRQVDYPVMILSFAASSCLIYGLEAGSLSLSRASPSIVTTFTIGGILWIAFVFWQMHLSSSTVKHDMKAIFPVCLVKHRVIAANIATGFFAGFAFFVVLVNIPQKFQIENSLCPNQASVRLIPLLVMSAAGASFTGQLCARKAWDCYILLFACGLQIIALGLLSSLSASVAV